MLKHRKKVKKKEQQQYDRMEMQSSGNNNSSNSTRKKERAQERKLQINIKLTNRSKLNKYVEYSSCDEHKRNQRRRDVDHRFVPLKT